MIESASKAFTPFPLSFSFSFSFATLARTGEGTYRVVGLLGLFDLLRRRPMCENGNYEGAGFGKAHRVHVLELAELEVRGGFLVAADLFASSRGGRILWHCYQKK